MWHRCLYPNALTISMRNNEYKRENRKLNDSLENQEKKDGLLLRKISILAHYFMKSYSKERYLFFFYRNVIIQCIYNTEDVPPCQFMQLKRNSL